MSRRLLALMGNSATTTVDIGDNIANSLMLDSASSQYLSRTFGSPTDATKFTMSCWCKRGKINDATLRAIFMTNPAGAEGVFWSDTSDRIKFYENAGANSVASTASYRDPAAWYHVLYTYDNAVSPKSNLYVNNVSVATSTTAQTKINTAIAHYIGAAAQLPDHYISQLIFVDGQALTPSSFGRTSADTGQWVNKTYTGTYGNNGFKLDFSNSAALGTDSSGNGNNWTLNGGISSANQYTDTPTNNYCVWNVLSKNSAVTISKGNLTYVDSNPTNATQISSMFVSSGKWYFEVTVVAIGGGNSAVGVATSAINKDNHGYTAGQPTYIYRQDGNYLEGSTGAAYGATYTTNDVIGVALDCGAGTVTFYKNNTSQGTKTGTGLAGLAVAPCITSSQNTASLYTGKLNAGAVSFANTTVWATLSAAGFKALSTANLP